MVVFLLMQVIRNLIIFFLFVTLTLEKYLVTVGFQHDGSVFVWDWKAGSAAASNKITTKVYAVSFNNGIFFFLFK